MMSIIFMSIQGYLEALLVNGGVSRLQAAAAVEDVKLSCVAGMVPFKTWECSHEEVDDPWKSFLYGASVQSLRSLYGTTVHIMVDPLPILDKATGVFSPPIKQRTGS